MCQGSPGSARDPIGCQGPQHVSRKCLKPHRVMKTLIRWWGPYWGAWGAHKTSDALMGKQEPCGVPRPHKSSGLLVDSRNPIGCQRSHNESGQPRRCRKPHRVTETPQRGGGPGFLSEGKSAPLHDPKTWMWGHESECRKSRAGNVATSASLGILVRGENLGGAAGICEVGEEHSGGEGAHLETPPQSSAPPLPSHRAHCVRDVRHAARPGSDSAPIKLSTSLTQHQSDSAPV